MSRATTLTEEKRKYFKNVLTQTLNAVLSEKRQDTLSIAYLKDESGDFTDRASLDIDNTLNLRIREREGRLIHKIKDALIRLENGTFGICEECGSEIPEKRLQVRPIARLCIRCKEKEEIAEEIGARWSA
ncbi:MAG: TraR/DksA C4-type zinc finger protein [Desulfobacterales bacterium]|nr:MAG: TraR/DksA C4-type zinc finger protein [Desulfobacterales bacterium]